MAVREFSSDCALKWHVKRKQISHSVLDCEIDYVQTILTQEHQGSYVGNVLFQINYHPTELAYFSLIFLV